MAFLDPNEIFFTPFEPKMKNRFIMEIDGFFLCDDCEEEVYDENDYEN